MVDETTKRQKNRKVVSIDQAILKRMFPGEPEEGLEVVVNGTTYKYVTRPKSKDDFQT